MHGGLDVNESTGLLEKQPLASAVTGRPRGKSVSYAGLSADAHHNHTHDDTDDADADDDDLHAHDHGPTAPATAADPHPRPGRRKRRWEERMRRTLHVWSPVSASVRCFLTQICLISVDRSSI
jgi:hypothetical protein